jgi:hypothetical protein
MITSTKPSAVKAEKNVNELNQPTLPLIKFLYQDGSLHTDKYSISPKNHFVSERDNLSYGKIEEYPETDNGPSKTVHYLKQFRGGRPGEYLPNPWGPLATAYDLSTNNDKRGERFCEYVRVREGLFNSYQDYLKTRNPLVFQGVEKAFLDGDI